MKKFSRVIPLLAVLTATFLLAAAPAPPAAIAEPDAVLQARIAMLEQPAKDAAVKREVDDLAAQQSMATSAKNLLGPSWAQVLLAGLGTLGLIVTLAISFRSLELTRQSLSDQAAAAEKQMRAYVGVALVGVAPESLAPGEEPVVFITFKNYGATPASLTKEKLTFRFVPQGTEAPLTSEPIASDTTINPDGQIQTKLKLGRRLTQEEADGFTGADGAPSHVLQAVGEISYETFEKRRCTRYAVQFYGAGAGNKTFLSGHNKCD